MRRPVLPSADNPPAHRQPGAQRTATPGPSPQAPRRAAPSWSNWTVGGRRIRGEQGTPATARAPIPRSQLWAGGLVALLALVGLALVLFNPFGGSSSGETAERWATFARPSCEWSNATTPPGICFGERPVGYRVRVLEQKGPRWMVWDPATQGPAYVDGEALKQE